MASDHIRTYQPGEVLCREGDIGREAYLIQSGRVRVSRKKDDKDVVLAELGENEIVGEFSIVDEEPRSATVIALVETQVVRINKGRLWIIFERLPEVATTIVKLLVHKLREANRRQAREISPTDWRFWRQTLYLILLVSAVGNEDSDDISLPSKETRANLAIALGISLREVDLVVERLVQANVLELKTEGGNELLSLRMSEINMIYNYIDHTFRPGSAEPQPSLETETRQAAVSLLDLCHKHYGSLSAAISTFKRDALIEFILQSDVFEGNSPDMRKRMVTKALDNLQENGFLKPHEGSTEVVKIDLDALADRVEGDLGLEYCRERYRIMSRPWKSLPKV